MAFNILSEFTGDCNITQSRYGNADLDVIIDTVEEKILKDLFGEDLYAKVILTPTEAPYLALVSGTTYDVVNADGVTCTITYKGIKQMLKYFTYAEILKHQQTQASDVGQQEPLQNNSQRVPRNNLSELISQSYNKGLALYGYDIDNYAVNDSFIRGRRFQETVKILTEYDYYREYLKGTVYNYLSYCKTNFPLYFPTWIFTTKKIMGFNGWL